MKVENSIDASMEKCLARLQKLIPKPESRFTATETARNRHEILIINLNFIIQGAWMSRTGRAIQIHIIIEEWSSKDIDADLHQVHRMATSKIEEELDWMKGVPWELSVDPVSLRGVQRRVQKKIFIRDIAAFVRRHEMLSEDVAETLSELLIDIKPTLRDVLACSNAPEDNNMISIVGGGLPCPICQGHLSEDDINRLYYWSKHKKNYEWGDRD